MSGTALPPPDDPDGIPPVWKERRTLRRFLKHIVMGYIVGTAIGIIGYGVILLVIGPDKVSVPWLYTVLVLYQAGMMGGFVGAGVFMSRFKNEDDDDDKRGGTKAPVTVSEPETPARRPKPARPRPAPGGPLPQPV
jgi:hypothetical protein